MHLQLQQLLNLIFILFLGIYVENIYLSLSNIFLILIFTIFVEYLFIYIKNRKFEYISFSSLSTAIGVILMLVTPHIWLTMFVIALALFQKHFLTIGGKHFFNPSNFALILALVLFYNDAHIVLGQLGDTLWLKLILGVVALSILVRINRWIIPLGFVLFYMVFEYLFVVSYDPILVIEDIYYRFYSVSFMVFILFMLTDPKTTPSSPWQQLFFALFIGLGSSFFDRIYGFRVQHLFMVLFLLSPLVPILTSKNKKQFLMPTIFVLFLAIGVIIFIQSQAPYYFEMDI
jgi:hypothetical protein